jgi:3-hydroxyacyl-CoA dehydrogenase
MTDNVIQSAGIREVAVIGLGLMGSGIVELVASSGRRVVAIELNQDFLDQGMARLHASLDKAVSRGKLAGAGRAEILARVRPADGIAAGVAGADLVIEAIPERMELKRTSPERSQGQHRDRDSPGQRHSHVARSQRPASVRK